MVNIEIIPSMFDGSIEQGSDVEIDIIEIKHLLADEITRHLQLDLVDVG